jgi:prenyltransferase beta subunit
MSKSKCGDRVHSVCSYAAVATLVTIGTDEALQAIDRAALTRFLYRMCAPAGRGQGMMVHQGGEIDVRAAYLATASAHMALLDTEALAERAQLVSYICRCQSHEARTPAV